MQRSTIPTPAALDYLFNRPDLLRNLLVPHVDIDQLSRCAQTCRGFNALFKPIARISQAAHFIIVKPSVIKIRAILDQQLADELLKEFLQIKVNNVLSQSGITYTNMTLLQLAYSAGDDEMCLVLEQYFEKAFDGVEAARKEINKQLNEKFAKECEAEQAQRKQLRELLGTVIQAISAEKFNLGAKNEKFILSPDTYLAIDAFKKGLDALQPKVIDKGKHTYYNILEELFDTYERIANEWGYTFTRCALFEDGVIATALLRVPEAAAQKFSQGLLYLLAIDSPEHNGRSVQLRSNNQNFYKALREESADFSNLMGSCVDIKFGDKNRRYANKILDLLKQFNQKKNSNLENLYARSCLASDPKPK